MLYTQKSNSSNISMLSAGVLKHSMVRSLICSFLVLLSCSVVYAEDTETLLIPAYDNSIYNDGYDRWNQNYNSKGYLIHSSILFENLDKQNYDAKRLRENDAGRYDRTSNHLPISYNITMKGYSVYEANDESIKLWSFDKINLNMNKKPELFFGVQKPFY